MSIAKREVVSGDTTGLPATRYPRRPDAPRPRNREAPEAALIARYWPSTVNPCPWRILVASGERKKASKVVASGLLASLVTATG